jgi:hypothetical protein
MVKFYSPITVILISVDSSLSYELNRDDFRL